MFSFHFLCLVVFTSALFLKVKSNIKYLTVDVADKNIINTEVKWYINAIVFVLFWKKTSITHAENRNTYM